MIPKGFIMMLKQLLPALGIKIDPAEVEQLFENLKKWIPEVVTYSREKLSSMDGRLSVIEDRITMLEQNMRLLMDDAGVRPIQERTDYPRSQGLINGTPPAPDFPEVTNAR